MQKDRPPPSSHAHAQTQHTHARTYIPRTLCPPVITIFMPPYATWRHRAQLKAQLPPWARAHVCVCVCARKCFAQRFSERECLCVYVCARACAFAMPSPVWSRAAASLHAAATCLKSAKKRRQIQIVRSACTPRRTLAKSETRQAQGSALPHLSLMRHGRRASCCSPSLPLPETPVSFTTVSAVSATTW